MVDLSGNDDFIALKDLKGEFIWINGSLGSGKTSLCLDIAVQALANGNTVLYLQNPDQITLEKVQEIAIKKELIIDADNFLLAGPDDVSHALVLLEEGISLDPVIVIIDAFDQFVLSGIEDPINDKSKLLEFLSILKQFTTQDQGVVIVTTTNENADLWFITLLEKFETCMVEVKLEDEKDKTTRQLIFLRDGEERNSSFTGQVDSRIDKTSSSKDWS
ncbi:MAG: AAA family ATPase [Candidatus Hodarchaeales archaeon]